MLVWLEDEAAGAGLMPLAQAKVGVLDRGITIGDGVFETLKVVNQQPFALDRHLRRMARSAAVLGIEMPPAAHISAAVAELCAAELVGPLGRMRITLTHGTGQLADPYADAGAPTLLITLVQSQPWPASAQVALSRFRRNEHSGIAGVKSTSYAENAVALREARAQGASEALLANTAGLICEGTGSNIVLGVNGRLITPTLGSGCLAGITRELVLQWCEVVEEDLPMASLAQINEAFLTSSTRDVQPISQLGGVQLATPGPLTAQAMSAWEAHSTELNP